MVNMHFKFSLVAIFSLALCLAAQEQNKPPAAATRETKPNNDSQLYRSATFGFRYQIPFAWVDRTKQMREGNEPAKGEVLLAIFERPPEATGDTVNSAVVIASESAASYPGLKSAEEYLGPLTELATAQGFKSEGEPGTLQIDARQLFRADFVKPLVIDRTADNTAAETNDKLLMRQCTLVLLAKGKLVSFTFIAGSQDEINDLLERLHFAAAKSPPHSN
jgi:hypothetical protein